MKIAEFQKNLIYDTNCGIIINATHCETNNRHKITSSTQAIIRNPIEEQNGAKELCGRRMVKVALRNFTQHIHCNIQNFTTFQKISMV